MIKKLTKVIEESKMEKERLIEQKEKLRDKFKEIEQKAFAVQESYKKTQEVCFYSSSSVLMHISLHSQS